MLRNSRNENGFVLAAAILAMVVVGAVVAAGYVLGNQQAHVAKSMRSSISAFYAAQAGLERVQATWSMRERWTMDGGDSVAVGPVILPNGTRYAGTVTRIDDAPESDTHRERYYLLRITGWTDGPNAREEARSEQGLILRVRYYDLCCTAAITAKGHFVQAGNSVVDGRNHTPAAWEGRCDSASAADVAGVEVECDTCFSGKGHGHVTAGQPPREVDATLRRRSLTEWDEVSWDVLTSKAQQVYTDGETVTNPAPVYAVDPLTGRMACDVTVRSNWGEPRDPFDVCFEHFPVLYAKGSLTIDSGGAGQGLLLVEGDLTLKGGFEFYGVVLVRGHVLTEGNAGKIWGGLVIGGQDMGSMTSSHLAGDASVRYSACAVARTQRNAELARREPLPLRAWVEALN